MDEEETKCCPNCKREIPAVNFTIHTVHCARNIKICPVCKEPVPCHELDEHHEKLHKLLPCKQCGESVCGTDLEDHIRDSCANTVRSCRYCELELPRRELPAHEAYCGARTEQCAACGEYVMIKYRQLHVDSNHGFIRLDDDPVPNMEQTKHTRSSIKSNIIGPTNTPINGPFTRPASIFDEFNRPSSSTEGFTRLSNDITPSTFGNPRPHNRPNALNINTPISNTAKINSSNSVLDSSKSNLSNAKPESSNNIVASQELLRQRIAANFDNPILPSTSRVPPNVSSTSSRAELSNPKPSSSNRMDSSNAKPGSSNEIPCSSNQGSGPSRNIESSDRNASNLRLPSYNRPNNLDIPEKKPKNINQVNGSSNSGFGAAPSNINQEDGPTSVLRTNGVRKRTNDQPQINTNTRAVKTVDKDLGVSRGAVKKRPAPPPPPPAAAALLRRQQEETRHREQNLYNLAHGLPPVLNAAQKLEKLRKMDALHNREVEEAWRPPPPRARSPPPHAGHMLGGDDYARQHFRNLKPMSPNQFMRRFSSMQVSPPAAGDRFPQIKSSLRELRRGLNEVTAPYNVNNNMAANNNNGRGRHEEEEVRLPCEFCGHLLPADDLVQHQTGCRPDLARLSVGPPSRSPSPRCPRSPSPPCPRSPSPRSPRSPSPEEPVIPCEFCAESLPVYAIDEHQERCFRQNMRA